MPPSEESAKIAGAFSRYATTGDKNLIQDILEDKLEIALMQYAADKRFPHYSAMEMRLNELKEERKSKRTQKDKWKDRIIGAIFGILVTLIAAYLKSLLKWN